jgi:LmbE family N-acetylglucosaminyl deacetylase
MMELSTKIKGNRMHILINTKTRRFFVCAIILLLTVSCPAIVSACGLWNSDYVSTKDSFFYSDFIAGKKVLVFVAHEDDEVSLAYGVIDAFIQAESDVTVAFSTNGDAWCSGDVRVSESIKAEEFMGVSKENIILLGYGDHMMPPFFIGHAKTVRKSEAGYLKTYGVEGIKDYHSLCFGETATYTRENFEGDIYTLIMNLRPDIIFVSDTDFHIDHVAVSQSFDRVMGTILRENVEYQPMVFKGFCYDYAWYGNADFYQSVMLQSTQPSWNAASYHTSYTWSERVRFPLPNEYLSYTLRGSKLHALLLSYQSQDAVSHQNNLTNGDRIFWQRRTDVLWANVTATSGNASLLQDFVLGDTMEAPLENCWMPDHEDTSPAIKFTWSSPQVLSELVFYDAPSPAGDIRKIQISDDSGYSIDFELLNGTGEPCRLTLDGHPVQILTIRILESEGSPIGFSEIEILPKQNNITQWIHLMDQDMNFIYEYTYPANQTMELFLYGYPKTPVQAIASIIEKESGETIVNIPYDGTSFHIPPLENGYYRIEVKSGNCQSEANLRIGDTMLKERMVQLVEQIYNSIASLKKLM